MKMTDMHTQLTTLDGTDSKPQPCPVGKWSKKYGNNSSIIIQVGEEEICNINL